MGAQENECQISRFFSRTVKKQVIYKVSSNMFNLNTACSFHSYYLLQPLIESALLKMWLKVERSSLQFMNINLLRTKWNENWIFSGFPLSITIWQVYTYRPVAGPRTHYAKRTLEYYLQIWFKKTCKLFFASRKNISCMPLYTKNLSFSGHLIAYAWIQNILK